LSFVPLTSKGQFKGRVQDSGQFKKEVQGWGSSREEFKKGQKNNFDIGNSSFAINTEMQD
jgi:hypothetical protein